MPGSAARPRRLAVAAPTPEGRADRAVGEPQVGEEGVLDLVRDAVDDRAEVVALDPLGFERTGVGADLVDRAHHVADEVEEVDTDVDRAAAAALQLAVAPGGAGHDLVRRPVAADPAGDPELRLADHPLLHDPVQGANPLGVAQVLGDADDQAALLRPRRRSPAPPGPRSRTASR